LLGHELNLLILNRVHFETLAWSIAEYLEMNPIENE
jgi:hypothetical protein